MTAFTTYDSLLNPSTLEFAYPDSLLFIPGSILNLVGLSLTFIDACLFTAPFFSIVA